MKKRLECKVFGRVQMVMFRDFIQRNASALGLAGEVKNCEDGSVFFVAEGEEDALLRLFALARKGSLLSHVEYVEETWSEPSGAYMKFRIVYR
jgi:acylphosphatase